MLSQTDPLQAVPSQPFNMESSGVGSSFFGFKDSQCPIPDFSPDLNPWTFFPPPARPRDPATSASCTESKSSQHLSPIQREILSDFPFLSEELHHRGLNSAGASSSSEASFPGFCYKPNEVVLTTTCGSKEDSDISGSGLDQIFIDQLVEWAHEAAGPSAESRIKRKRQSVQEDGKDGTSDKQESRKPINRPRKKGGVMRVREPRYAIKTRTESEVMDDGYKWRKYGQKAVKSSPYPRNYYRCTTPNCPVRKRVERCCEDPGMVVTIYEGTHSHRSPSFLLLGSPGDRGTLQGLLSTLSHQYRLAGNPALPPPFSHPTNNVGSDVDRSPLGLSQFNAT